MAVAVAPAYSLAAIALVTIGALFTGTEHCRPSPSADRRPAAVTTVRQKPWERYYMYAVSFIAGLLVLGRLVNRWTVDTTTWSIVPRPDPLLILSDENPGGFSPPVSNSDSQVSGPLVTGLSSGFSRSSARVGREAKLRYLYELLSDSITITN